MDRVLIIGNYVPRRCGIATFTEDHAESLRAAGAEVAVIAMNDRPEGYEYPELVRFQIRDWELQDYHDAAEFIRGFDPDVVSVQHEFGIFGGPAGSNLIELLRDIDCPIVTTLHTVLREPTENQMSVMKSLSALSSRIVVMSEKGKAFLQETFGIAPSKIDVIHHGVHELDRSIGVEDGRTIATFGLLGPDKGIENVISALPDILSRHPKARYRIIGATHPHLVAQHGEAYRESLVEKAKELGVLDRIEFIDRYVSREELAKLMAETSIYVTPYNKLQQITSGTLAYAVGTGRAIVSTPYWHAEELLEDGRGILVPVRDPGSIANAIKRLLDNPNERVTMATRALEFGEQMLWPNVAQAYLDSFRRAKQRNMTFELYARRVPEMDFRHLRALSDDTGLLQHATFATANRSEGYCLDDNARAFQLVTEASAHLSHVEAVRLSQVYLAFMWHAFDRDRRVFRNFLSYDRKWLDDEGSEDSQGRAIWALGIGAKHGVDEQVRHSAQTLFDEAIEHAATLKSLRAMAFTLLGIIESRSRRELIQPIADRLHRAFQENARDKWQWFEPSATYCNAVLPHALLAAGAELDNEAMRSDALIAMNWIAKLQTVGNGVFSPVGSHGFADAGRVARFDQQPVEAWTSIAAFAAAFRSTGDPLWFAYAKAAFEWFLGRNALGQPLFDEASGGCRDGMHADRLNLNQGAESTLSFQMGLQEWLKLNQKLQARKELSIVHSM
jgi:glycosyltransferase involved in cell wall biosynthesis